MTFAEITATEHDATHLRHRLSLEDIGQPDLIGTSEIFRYSKVLDDIVEYGRSLLDAGRRIEDVIRYVHILAVRDGWYMREEIPSSREIESIVSEADMEEILKEIRRK